MAANYPRTPKMPIATAFIRVFTALMLSVPAFLGFGYYFVATAANATLLDADFVAGSLQRAQVYVRIHREVFLQDEFNSWTTQLAGGLQISDEDKAELLEQSIPPTYVRQETERNVVELLEYLTGDGNQLELFIDLTAPLENARPIALAFLAERVSELDPRPLSTPEELSAQIASFLNTVEAGEIPDSAPSGTQIGLEQRVWAYQQAIDALSQDPSASPQAIAHLKAGESEILTLIRSDDLRGALKLSSVRVAEPHIDSELARFARNTDQQNRVDLVDLLAKNSERTSVQMLRDLRLLRFALQGAISPITAWLALILAIACVIAIAAVFIPYWRQAILWPSLVLSISGSLLLLLAFSITLDTSYWSSLACQERATAPCELSLDVAREIATGIGSWLAEGSLKLILIGATGLVVFFVVTPIFRRRSSGIS